jgi:uncharacterized membrane protein
MKKARESLKTLFFLAFIGYLLVVPEFVFGYYELALYQLLAFSIYLQFIVLFKLVDWSVRRHIERAEFRLVIARLIYVAVVPLFWLLNDSLLGLITKVSQFTIWLYSFAVILILTLTASISNYLINERKSISIHKEKGIQHKSGGIEKYIHTLSTKTVVLISPIMIICGALLIYFGLSISDFGHLEAFGLVLILMGVIAPITRISQDHRRKLKHNQRKAEEQQTQKS